MNCKLLVSMDNRKNTATESSTTLNSKIISRRTSSPMKKCLKFDDEPRRKKRRKKILNKNEKMRNIIIDIEKEIEEQLDAKTEDDDFTTTNVKGILKELIMDEDMKEMVRQTLHPGDRIGCYEPKLTRAKVRKLLELRPDLKVPILWPLPQNNTNFVSECLSLINEDFSENSSEDEEYKPDDEENDQTDSLIHRNTNILDNGSSSGKNFNSGMKSDCTNSSCNSTEVEENIGQRTRSKLPLTETRLEDIEQTFNPPDITVDMYDYDIDNEDYLNFLREYNTSYDRRNLELADIDDDLDDDPEYRIPADAETVDKEELRQDESTEVPSAELRQLINEIIGGNEPMKTIIDRKKLLDTDLTDVGMDNDHTNADMSTSSLSEVQASNPSLHQKVSVSNRTFQHGSTEKQDTELLSRNKESAASPNLSPQRQNLISSARPYVSLVKEKINVSPPKPIIQSPVKNFEHNGTVMSKQQKLLFEQQLRQHVQLTTMHFLQCYKHPDLHRFAKDMKNVLVSLQLLAASSKTSAYCASNLDDSLKLVNDWEKVMADVPDPEKLGTKPKKKVGKRRRFSPGLMKVVCKSSIFLYPLLLPEKPFANWIERDSRSRELTKSEEWLLAIGLQQFCEHVQYSNKSNNNNKNIMREALELVKHYLLPFHTPSYLLHIINKRKNEDPDRSSVKYYLKNKKAPPLKHFVVPVSPIPLYEQPDDLLPKSWRDYISNNFVVLKR